MRFSLCFTDDEYKKLTKGEPATASRMPSPEKRLTIEFDAKELHFLDREKNIGNDCRVRLRHKPIERPAHVVHTKKTPKK